MNDNIPAANPTHSFEMDALGFDCTMTVYGVTDDGAPVQSELTRLSRTIELESTCVTLIHDDNGEFIGVQEVDRYTGDPISLTRSYFTRTDEEGSETRVSRTLVPGQRFFDGSQWMTIHDYEVRR